MRGKITIKDIHKERVVYLEEEGFSEAKAMGLITKILIWLQQKDIGLTDLPLVVLEKNKSFKACIPIKDAKLKEEGNFKIDILPSHRMGILVHEDVDKPISLTENFLERQLKYDGFSLLEPRRYIFHQNKEKPELPIVEIQIPVHK